MYGSRGQHVRREARGLRGQGHLRPNILEAKPLATLATCINYAEINNSMLHMHGHVSAGFFRRDVLFLQGKHSGFRHVVASA